MLYDNASMLENLTDADRLRAGDGVYRRAAKELVGWLKEEMSSAEGLLYAALDADSEGEEGKFYVWRLDELDQVLGASAGLFANAYGFSQEGNFRDEATDERTGQNIPHLERPIVVGFEPELATLRRARANRTRPGTDFKCLVGWNGLAIAALANSGEVAMASRAAEAVWQAIASKGSVPRQVTGGKALGEGFLEDYAYFAYGLYRLGWATDGSPWRERADELTSKMIEQFYDAAEAGFWATSESHEKLFGKSKPLFDQPAPSANAIAIRCLIELGDLTRAQASLDSFSGWMGAAPESTEALYTSGLMLLNTLKP
jgi:uncharacterized protein YyaL (SSP411 family)